MKILGIDPGLSVTGYGVIRVTGKEVENLVFGGIRAPRGASFSDKLLAINQGINQIIQEYQPDYCAVEEVFYHQNQRTAIVMAHARAAAMLAAAQNHIPVAEYSPREVKMSVVGNGNASKVQIQAMVKNILHLPETPQPEDAADALSVALCHYHRLRFRNLMHSATTGKSEK